MNNNETYVLANCKQVSGFIIIVSSWLTLAVFYININMDSNNMSSNNNNKNNISNTTYY